MVHVMALHRRQFACKYLKWNCRNQRLHQCGAGRDANDVIGIGHNKFVPFFGNDDGLCPTGSNFLDVGHDLLVQEPTSAG